MQGCKELDCTARDCKVPVAAARTRVVRPGEVSSSRLVAVVRIVVVVHIVAAAARTVEVVQATGSRRPEDTVIACSAAFRAGVVLGMESSVVAGPAQQMRRQQPDVPREACRGRVWSQSWSQRLSSVLPVVEVPRWCAGAVGVCLGKAQTRSRSKVGVMSLYLRRVVRLVLEEKSRLVGAS